MLNEFNTDLLSVVTNFLERFEIPFTKRTLQKRLQTNPYYPSLYSVSRTLNWYNIEYKTIQIKKEQLDLLPLPFLAYMHIKERKVKDFVNVIKVHPKSITFFIKKKRP